MKPLAILGGAFDPLHLGHLYLAQHAAADFGCTVRLLPNGCPPHRAAPIADWSHRLAMCRLATASEANISVGEEESPHQPRYTADTLAELKRRYPDTPLLLIIGADAAAAFADWHQPERILQLAHLVVVPRPPAPTKLPEGAAVLPDKAALAHGGSSGGVYLWDCQPPAVSASHIRSALAAGAGGAPSADNSPFTDWLPPAVAEYISRQRLYLPT